MYFWPVLLMTAFVLQGHIYCVISRYMIIVTGLVRCTCFSAWPSVCAGLFPAVFTPEPQLYGAGERAVTCLVRRRDLHQVNVSRLQLLQKSHRVWAWNQKPSERCIQLWADPTSFYNQVSFNNALASMTYEQYIFIYLVI